MEYRNFIIPKPAAMKFSRLKEEAPKRYAMLMEVIEEVAEVSQSYGVIKDKKLLMDTLIVSIDLGLATFGLDEYGNISIYMWNYDKGEYLPLTNNNFDAADMATLLRVNAIMLSLN